MAELLQLLHNLNFLHVAFTLCLAVYVSGQEVYGRPYVWLSQSVFNKAQLYLQTPQFWVISSNEKAQQQHNISK